MLQKSPISCRSKIGCFVSFPVITNLQTQVMSIISSVQEKMSRKIVLANLKKGVFLGKSCWKKLKKLFTNIFRYLKAKLTKLINQILAVTSSRQFSLYSHSILFVVFTKVRKNFRRMRNEDI